MAIASKLLAIAILLQAQYIPFDQEHPEASIRFWSDYYSIDYQMLYDTLECESGFNPNAKGDNGTSFGVAQIHLNAHPSVTLEEAYDPNFAIHFAAKSFAEGNSNWWTCKKTLYGDKDPLIHIHPVNYADLA